MKKRKFFFLAKEAYKLDKKILTDQKGGLINSPGAYLFACTGREYRLKAGIRAEADFGLRQIEYESKDGKACPNCTPAALINALGYYRHSWPQIPDDPHACYQLLRKHLRLFRSPLPGIGGYPAPLNATLTRRLWRLLGIDAWPAVYPFPGARRLRMLSSEGIPLILSIWTKAYRAHTVLLLGWELWSDGQTSRLFWVIRDGWRHEPRYLDAEEKGILQAVLMAG